MAVVNACCIAACWLRYGCDVVTGLLGPWLNCGFMTRSYLEFQPSPISNMTYM